MWLYFLSRSSFLFFLLLLSPSSSSSSCSSASSSGHEVNQRSLSTAVKHARSINRGRNQGNCVISEVTDILVQLDESDQSYECGKYIKEKMITMVN